MNKTNKKSKQKINDDTTDHFYFKPYNIIYWGMTLKDGKDKDIDNSLLKIEKIKKEIRNMEISLVKAQYEQIILMKQKEYLITIDINLN